MRVLQSISPSRYRKYFDRIFHYARKYHIQIILDLHGLPGSQNGEMHSGLTVEYSQFDTDWNKQKAIEAVEEMVKYCINMDNKDKESKSSLSTLYGIQIINEPNHYRDDDTNNHDFLDTYYDEAIRAARQVGLPLYIPLIVFEWTYNFDRWPDNRFDDYDIYGDVIWDTHVYHTNMNMNMNMDMQQQKQQQQQEEDKEANGNDGNNVVVNENLDPSFEDHTKRYWNDLCAIEQFHNRQLPGGVIVGEWSLAGPTWTSQKNQQYAVWMVSQFNKRCHGSLFWTWDADITEWSFQKSKLEFGIDWKGISEAIGKDIEAETEAVVAAAPKPKPNIFVHEIH